MIQSPILAILLLSMTNRRMTQILLRTYSKAIRAAPVSMPLFLILPRSLPAPRSLNLSAPTNLDSLRTFMRQNPRPSPGPRIQATKRIPPPMLASALSKASSRTSLAASRTPWMIPHNLSALPCMRAQDQPRNFLLHRFSPMYDNA